MHGLYGSTERNIFSFIDAFAFRGGSSRGANRVIILEGPGSQGIASGVSMVLAWILLVLVSQLSGLHWFLLVLDAASLAFAVGPVTRYLNHEFKKQYVAVIARVGHFLWSMAHC